MRDMMRDCGQIGIRNWMLAVVVGLISCVSVLVFGLPGIDPAMWDEVAAVAGIRPPVNIFPGFWRILTWWIFALFGIDGATHTLVGLGALGAGVCTAILYLIIRQVLALLIRTSHPFPVWYRRIAPLFAFVGAFLFGVGSPLMRVAQAFSPGELRLLMLLVTVHLLLRWFTVGGRWRLFPAMALMGFLAAETPFGFLLPLLFVCTYKVVWHCILDELFPKPEKLPEPMELPKWRMFFLFLGALAVGIWMNGACFIALDGAAACGWETGDVYFRYGIGYWTLFRGAATLIAWVLALGLCIVPMVLAIRIFPMVVRDDRPMLFAPGVMLFFIGILALMQSGALPQTQFWTFPLSVVHSGFLLSVFNVCAMLTVSLFGAAFAFECQRTYLAPTDEDGDVTPPGVLLRWLAPFIALIVLALASRAIPRPVESEMQRIVNAAVAETVRECEGITWLFTDGRLDAGVEIEAARQGKTLRTLNMMSGGSEWEVSLRCRGLTPGTADYETAKTGIPVLLRVWAGEKTNGMDGVAIQLGFEFWRRDRKPLPKVSGMVAIEKGLDDATAAEGAARAKAIADRILALGDEPDSASPSAALSSAFSAVNWRISRFAKMRDDMETAKGLDNVNGALRRMFTALEAERQRTFMQMTPREGLEISLRRANFAEARRYAMAVLANNEDDPQANFAMGMDAISSARYKDAEFYLTRVLKQQPKEPATLNNLSIVCRKQHKYKEAEDYARRALEILPDAKEVQSTLKEAIEKAP